MFGFIGLVSTFVAAVLIDGKMATKHIFPSTGWEWGALFGLGFLSFVIQVSFTKALQFQMAAIVSMERKASDVIFAFLYQIAIFVVLVYLICYSIFRLITIL